ncbi:MAG TPA: GHKL domain-containing protein [Candidatus Cloacimonetes bacterium]|nr:GHKL domain-containing protein [Candidatus Cloacimonadota bacterium]HEX37689.1 GHKL domain-containing protein [Candidatus Cloacimonadota bacterium]
MDLLINDLLQFSRMGRHKINLVKVDTKALVDSLSKGLLQQNKNRKIEIQNMVKHDIMADGILISQVMKNIPANAIKFTRNEPQAIITVRSEETDNNIVLSVRDNGVGFDQKYEAKIFEVFQRLHTPDKFEGTGVGMAIVKKIVEKHDGKVWAKGEEGTGTTFYFSLPKIQSTREDK